MSIYYLATMTTQKNASGKKHIVTKSTDIEELREIGKNNINRRYIVQIYSGKWELVETIWEGNK